MKPLFLFCVGRPAGRIRVYRTLIRLASLQGYCLLTSYGVHVSVLVAMWAQYPIQGSPFTEWRWYWSDEWSEGATPWDGPGSGSAKTLKRRRERQRRESKEFHKKKDAEQA